MLVVAVVALQKPKGSVAAQGRASSVAKETPTQQTKDRTSAASKRVSSSAARDSSSAPRNGDSRSGASVKSVPLIVLNNTTTQGLARRAAQQFEDGGWKVTSYQNYQNTILSTCAYYDPADPKAEAAAEALQAQYPAIRRVKPKFSELPEGPVVVVLTPDYSAE